MEEKRHGEIDWSERSLHCGQCKQTVDVWKYDTIDELDRAWLNHQIEHNKDKGRKKRTALL